MTWQRVRLLLFGGVLVAAAGCSTNEPPTPTKRAPASARSTPTEPTPASAPSASEPAAPGDPRTDKLRGELDKVRKAIASRGDKKFAVGPVSPKHSEAWPLDALRRMHRRELRAQLGPPRACDERRITPCENSGDWVYAFYYLPKTHLGGGPELHLEFDSNDRCTRASWAFTR